MSQLLQTVSQLFFVRHKYAFTSDQYKAQGVLALCWMAVLTLIATAVLYPVTPGLTRSFVTIGPFEMSATQALYLSALLVVVIGTLFIAALLNRGHLTAASATLVLMLLLIAVQSHLSNGINSAMTITFTLPVIAAGVLLNRRALMTVVLLCAASIVVTYILAVNGALASVTIGALRPQDSVIYTLIILVADGVLLAIGVIASQASQQQAERLKTKLKGSETFSRLAARRASIDDALAEAIDLIREQLGYYHAQIFLAESRTNLLIVRSGPRGLNRDITQRRVATADDTGITSVLAAGESRIVTLNDPPAMRSEFLPLTRSALIIPMRYGDATVGVLDIQSVNANAFEGDECALLETLAISLAIMVQNERLTVQVKELDADRRLLQDRISLPAVDNRRGSPREISMYLESRADRVIGFDWNNGSLSANDRLNDTYQRVAHNAMPETRVEGDEHVLSVPVTLRGTALGVMEFRLSHEPGWGSRQIELARVIAQRLALALDNLRLFEQARSTAAREQLAAEVMLQLQTRNDMDSLVAVATESFRQALGANRVSIRLGTITTDAVEDTATDLPGNGHHRGNA